MCSDCGYLDAIKVMDRLKSIQLTRIYKWILEKKHITPRLWGAIESVAEAMGKPIRADEVPESVRLSQRSHPWSRPNPDLDEHGNSGS